MFVLLPVDHMEQRQVVHFVMHFDWDIGHYDL